MLLTTQGTSWQRRGAMIGNFLAGSKLGVGISDMSNEWLPRRALESS
jgi:hypothetical protein